MLTLKCMQMHILAALYSFNTFTHYIIFLMLKRILLFVFVIAFISAGAQKLQSPEEFLGYKVGTHFTPHFKIVNYFNAVAQAKPDMVKIEQYGSTYEGRPLLLT